MHCYVNIPSFVLSRWHKFCSSLYPNSTLCVTDTFGKNVLTVPKYSNLCDALCHTRIQKKMRICPTEEGEEPRQIFPTGFQVEAGPGESKRVILSYGNSEYLVITGCPVQNKRVQRYYQLCLTSYQHRTLCRQDRLAGGASITFPEYTDICSAMCHNTLDARQIFCPAKGRIIGPSPV